MFAHSLAVAVGSIDKQTDFLECFIFCRLRVDAANHSYRGGCIPSKLLHAPGVGDRMQPYTSLQEPNFVCFVDFLTRPINFLSYELVGANALFRFTNDLQSLETLIIP